ncbi:GNAT family N-acetyltransferase [Geminicoccus harenae]|uniref:GNAT family N-acetyltransferase n=1 Tax=Geminicoccus harenae TaxID=2498453 RepID=UPI001C98DD10|nr:GNAT family N-acetyltransferase [Geminicoccus harenae]
MAGSQSGFLVRPAGIADVPALFRIRTAVVENAMTTAELAALGITPSSIAADLDRGEAVAWLALCGGQEAGFSMVRSAEGDVFALFVLPTYEGRGIGRALLREAERWLADRGVVEAWLCTGAEPGLRAPGFYRAAGWREAGRMPDGQLRFVRSLRG